jgi:hypothetical protein
MSFWLRELTVESLLKAASEFEGERIEAAGLSGPVIGDKIEQVFLGRLEGQDFDIGRNVKRVAGRPDLPNLNCDIKALQLRGRRVGSAKIHGYSKDEKPPNYDMLVLTYSYDGEAIEIIHSHFIPCSFVKWVRAQHYTFSVPDRNLKQFRVRESC